MIVLRRILICMILLFPSLSLHAVAADRLEVEIRSTILNIREIMSTKSPVVGVLNRGDRLFVTTTGHQDWIRLDDGRGYISIHYVNVLTRTPVVELPDTAATADIIEKPGTSDTDSGIKEEETLLNGIGDTSTAQQAECIANSRNTRLNVNSVSKTCRKNLQTLSYEACDLTFNITLSSTCNSESKVNIECSAHVLAKESDGTEYLDELNYQGKAGITGTSEKIRLTWFPARSSMQITQTVLHEDNCLIKP